MAIKDKTLLTISASLELATGVAVIAAPDLVARVLFSADLTPGGEAIGRVGGCAFLSLAIACWPQSTQSCESNELGVDWKVACQGTLAVFAQFLRQTICIIFPWGNPHSRIMGSHYDFSQ
jgi:hypothetical protein